jgi:hypothetical protein
LAGEIEVLGKAHTTAIFFTANPKKVTMELNLLTGGMHQ